LVLALWVLSLREPARGANEGIASPEDHAAWRNFFGQVALIVPPFTLLGAARRGVGPLALNVAVATTLATIAWILGQQMGNLAQFAFVGIAAYAVFSWSAALRAQDRATFALTWGTPAFMAIVLAYGGVSFVGYAVTYWAAPYAERTFALSKVELGWWLGAPAALGGFLGVIFGGWLADRWQQRHAAGRLWVVSIGLLAPVPLVWVGYRTPDPLLFLACSFLVQMATSSALGASAAATQAQVQPRMRGTATAIFFLGATLIGLAFGPFTAGYVSELSEDLGTGVIATLALVPLGTAALTFGIARYSAAILTARDRAAAAGEPITRV
jgi:hypothetical protein